MSKSTCIWLGARLPYGRHARRGGARKPGAHQERAHQFRFRLPQPRLSQTGRPRPGGLARGAFGAAASVDNSRYSERRDQKFVKGVSMATKKTKHDEPEGELQEPENIGPPPTPAPPAPERRRSTRRCRSPDKPPGRPVGEPR